MDSIVQKIPKAELHVHIEGTVTPEMARQKAAEHNITLPKDIFSPDGQHFVWNNFVECVTTVYDAVANTIRTKQDFADITYDYLKRCADEGAIYVEMIASPEHGGRVGLSYQDMIEGMADGIDKARDETGIEGRINAALVRHLSDDEILKSAQTIASYDHPYIVGLDLAGAEKEGDVAKFKKYFKIIKDATNGSKGMRIHATEAAGPLNGWQALDLKIKRIGHGVRVIEDRKLLKELIKRGVVWEISIESNVLAGIYPSYDKHPLRKLYDAGAKITLNSDDPGLFGNSIGSEYQIAKDNFGFTDLELTNITRTAIKAAFVDDTLKQSLIKKVDQSDFFLKSQQKRQGLSP